MYQLRETLFDKFVSFNFPYFDDQKLPKDLAIVVFESICVQKDKFRDTDATKLIGKQVPISVSISSNLIEQPIFMCNSNPAVLVESFVAAFDGLALQSKEQMKLKFLDIENSVKTRLNPIFSTLNQRRCRMELVLEFEDARIEEEEQDVSTHFLQTKKNQPIDLAGSRGEMLQRSSSLWLQQLKIWQQPNK